MVRLSITLALALCIAMPARADEPPIEELDDGESFVSVDTMFDSLVSQGDIDRAAGRKIAAALKYRRALRIKSDSLVAGRLGMLLAQLGRVEDAAENLLEGLQRARNVSLAERTAWEKAYATVLAKGSWIRVRVSQAGARLILDGKRSVGRSTEFFLFIEPGAHTLEGTLQGFQDAKVAFTSIQGEDGTVNVLFESLPEPVAPLEPEVPELPELPPPQLLKVRAVIAEPNYSKQEDPFGYPEPATPTEKKTGVRGSVGGGPVVVFGVATWAPAVGLAVGGSVMPNQYVSLGLEGRAAWLASGIAERPIYAMTAGGLLDVCGHVRWAYGCALGYFGTMNVTFSDASYTGKSYSFAQPGLGGRLGAQLHVTPSFIVQGAVDVVALARGMKLVVNQTLVVDQPPVLLGAQITGGWEF